MALKKWTIESILAKDWLIFCSLQAFFPYFLEFALTTEHTGSRFDYEHCLPNKKKRDTPFIRTTYPVISHHRDEFQDWSRKQKIKKIWLKECSLGQVYVLTDWYLEKQKQLHSFITLAEIFKQK